MRLTSVLSVCGMFIAGAQSAANCSGPETFHTNAIWDAGHRPHATDLIGTCVCAGSVYQAMRKVLFQLESPGLMLQVRHPRNLRPPSSPVPQASYTSRSLTLRANGRSGAEHAHMRRCSPLYALQVHHFRKPWFVSLQGAVGCMLCFIPFWMEVLKHRR